MDVPWPVCPSENPGSICEVTGQDWMGLEKEAMGRNPASNSPFWRAYCEPGPGLATDGVHPPEAKGTAAVQRTDTLLSYPVAAPTFLVPEMNRSFSWNPNNKSRLIAFDSC